MVWPRNEHVMALNIEEDPDLQDIALAPTEEKAQREMDAYMRACVAIDPTRVQDEFVRIPADLAFWSARSDDAMDAYLRAKDALEKAEATAELAIRTTAANVGEKVTESVVRARVLVHPLYRDAIEKEITAETAKNRMRSIVAVIMTKKEMLISVGAHVRAEMQAHPAIRDQVAASSAYGKGGRNG